MKKEHQILLWWETGTCHVSRYTCFGWKASSLKHLWRPKTLSRVGKHVL